MSKKTKKPSSTGAVELRETQLDSAVGGVDAKQFYSDSTTTALDKDNKSTGRISATWQTEEGTV